MGEPCFFESTDGVKLAYYQVTAKHPIASLVFIHGGGAHSGAGYQHLAYELSEKYKVEVYLLDLRGHGRSEGPRGDSPTYVQVWQDIKTFTDWVENENSAVPLYVGGHSSGGGAVLNYLSWDKNSRADGYLFISPELGYKSETARKDIKHPFAKVKTSVFVINSISGGKLWGNKTAVSFNYPDEITASNKELIKSISCNMAIALTPNNPQTQFKNLNKPFALFVGEQDELFICPY